ncbi:MAG: hypothetical protein ABIG61_06845 [Planctomycetota bacterium]
MKRFQGDFSTTCRTKAIAAAVLACLIFPCAAGAIVLPDSATLVPAEIFAVINVNNMTVLKQQFERTDLYNLMHDPAMAAFTNDYKTRCLQKLRDNDNELIRIITDANCLPTGRITAAILSSEKITKAGKPPFLFILQWTDNIEKIKTVVEKIVEKDVQEGSRRSTEDFRGTAITKIIPATGGDEPEASVYFNYAFIENCLIASFDPEATKFTIAHIKGAFGGSAADNADYRSAMRTTGPVHDIDVYVNIKEIIAKAFQQDTAGRVRSTLSNFGLDNVASFACSAAVGRDYLKPFMTKYLLKINGPKKGLPKMLEVQSAAVQPPAFIDSTTSSVVLLNLDLRKLYEELLKIAASMDAGAAAAMTTPLIPASPDGKPGLDLSKDILAYLDPQVVIAETINKPFKADAEPSTSIFCVAVNNNDSLERSLARLHSERFALGRTDATRELLGYTIYTIGIPQFAPAMPAPPPMTIPPNTAESPKLAFAVTNTHLIIGTEQAVEKAIRMLKTPTSTPLTSTLWFRKCAAAIPSRAGMATFADQRMFFEYLWWSLKQSAVPRKEQGITINPFVMLYAGLAEYFNFSLLPEFDTVRKYFGLSVSYAISTDEGFVCEASLLKADNAQSP